MENWHHTYFNDWSAQYNYDGYGQPIPFHEYSSLTNALGFAEPIPQITFSSGQPLPIPSDTVHGVISPLVASGPFPAESSLGTATQSSFPPTVREHTESFVPMPFYSSNDRKYLKRCRQSSTPLNHRFIRFLPWGRTTKCYGGVPMNDCLVMRENSMSDADDHVFSFQAANQIIFRLRWPGYDNLEWVAGIQVATDYGILTRAQLASCIANEHKKFFDFCAAGLYEGSKPEWKVGHGRVIFDNLKLAHIWRAEDGVWLASVQIINPY